MMKTILVFVTMILTYISSYGQCKSDEYKKMVDSAIIVQSTQLDKVPYRAGIYLIDEKGQPYVLASDTDRKKFSYINVYDEKNKGLLKKGISAWKVIPVLNGNRLTVSIIDFKITYKNNNYGFVNGGGATVIFEYSCDTNTWVFRESKWSGI